MDIESEEFWKWVARQRSHDTPRGFFIRAVRDAFRVGADPNALTQGHCYWIEEGYGHILEEGYEAILTEWDELHRA